MPHHRSPTDRVPGADPGPDYVDAAGVAALLGLDGGKRPDLALLKRRALLEAQGFPHPLPTSKRPLLWRRASVLAWRAAVELLADMGERPRLAVAPANERAFVRATVAGHGAGRAAR